MDVQIYTDELQGKWVRVSHDDVIELDLQDQLTSDDTRMSPLWVYLDARQGGESDAAKFALALAQKRPAAAIDYTTNASTKSSIRQMAPYCKALLKFALIPGRVIKVDGSLWKVEQISERGRGKVFLTALDEVA